MMAYVTRYIFGTDKLRSNAFEVRGLNGISTGIINCDDLAIFSQWLKMITDNIVGLTLLQVNGDLLKTSYSLSAINIWNWIHLADCSIGRSVLGRMIFWSNFLMK